jgi:hypothetical protein
MSELMPIIIPIIVGIVFILAGSGLLDKRKRIIQNGIGVEGVIFGYETDSSGYRCPIIRFVTKEGLWITKKSDYGFSFLRKKNKKVSVVYNPANPEEFIYNTSFDVSKLSYLFLIIGILILLIGIWFGYKYLTTANQN